MHNKTWTMSIEVIGAGFGRTGTASLKQALEQLGYDRCYHMVELIQNPDGLQHWVNAEKALQVDWDRLFEDYRAIVDFPGSVYYKELLAHYPNAKVILTVRDPEKWYESVNATIRHVNPGIATRLKLIFSLPFSSTARKQARIFQHNDRVIWKKFFQNKFEDKDFAIEHFNRHIEEVKSHVPAEQLLVFDSKDGWEPICTFLGKEIPQTPYPSTNKRENFKEFVQDALKN